MKIFFSLLIVLCTLYGEENVLLNAHIRMIPKIMALDSRVQTRMTKSNLAIIYEGNRKNIARYIADEINLRYNGKIADIPFTAVVLSSDELLYRHDISFVYLTKMSETSVKKIAQWGIEHTIPTFSYDISDLEDGILGSITIERSTIIYINKSVLKEGKFHFNETLFQIARLIE